MASAAAGRPSGSATARTAALGTRSSKRRYWRRPRGAAAAARPATGPAAAPPAPSVCPRSSPRPPSASRAASTSSTACSAAASSRARSCWSAASPASASPRCCCRCSTTSPPAARRPGVRRGVGGAGQDARRAHLHGDAPTSTCSPRPSSISSSRPSAAARPAFVVVDSVQTLYSDGFTSAPGSVSQVRECGRALPPPGQGHRRRRLPGRSRHQGGRASPARGCSSTWSTRCSQFEGDRYRFYRTLRAAKNRFGSTNELGIFEMTGSGLKTVPDPSALFLSDAAPAAGSAVHVAVEGTRCFLVEVQALVNQTELAMPRRVAVGFDRNRLAMLVAVLGRHAGLKLSSSDIFVTIAGGIRIDEPAADLAVALAVASAQRDQPLPAGAAVFGEISLTGGLRSCSQSERRVAEAGRAGFDRIVVPAADARRTGGKSQARPICVVRSQLFCARVRLGRPPGPRTTSGGFDVFSRRQGRLSAPRRWQDHEDRAEGGARPAARLPHHPDPAQRHDRHGPRRERRPRGPA